NHPFIDGNKRTAFAATYTFLMLNGFAITADEDTLIRFLVPLYARGAIAFTALDKWLRKNTDQLQPERRR
ncbi:type II toxin-antitoxin system death-on-curing family toxin, partial [Microbacteriaceae bacterium K1510]|nr:type II toxin-antitoxin system death-on-curing family toxin [Microbacteriaceae bacterium K1510]